MNGETIIGLSMGLGVPAAGFVVGGVIWLIKSCLKQNLLMGNHLKHHEERVEPAVTEIDRRTCDMQADISFMRGILSERFKDA